MNWSTACPDWESRLINRQSIIPPPIFPDEAERALAIFKELRVVDLPGKPTFGECSDPWVFDFVSAVFGAYDCEAGNQLIREYYLLISKKNTKSTIAAGIMLTAVILCWREDEEHLIIAPTKEVATNSYKPAAGMVRADEELSDIFHVQDHIKTITHRVTKASLKVVAADTDTVSGKKSGRVLVDEHWLFGKKHNAKSMFMEVTGGQVSRNEGWVIYLTTQSDEQPAGVFAEKIRYFRKVRDGIEHDPKSLGILYEFPKKMVDDKSYLLEENFYITNPNIGRSVSQEWLADNLRKVKDTIDGSLQQFIAKHLNIEIGVAMGVDAWSGAPFWEQQAREHVTLDYLLENSDVIEIGIDGGGLDDMLGFAVLGRHAVSGIWLLWNKAWIYKRALERRKSEAPKYLGFAKDGDLSIIDRAPDKAALLKIGIYEDVLNRTDSEELPGNVTSYLNEEEVEQYDAARAELAKEDLVELVEVVQKCEESGLLDRIGVDRAGIEMLIDAIADAIIDESMGMKFDDKFTAINQGWQLSGTIKAVGVKLENGTLVHGGQKMMNWCVGNAKQEQKGNAVAVTKQISGTSKIDPLIALFCAAELMSMNPEPRNLRSVYEDNKILFV